MCKLAKVVLTKEVYILLYNAYSLFSNTTNNQRLFNPCVRPVGGRAVAFICIAFKLVVCLLKELYGKSATCIVLCNADCIFYCCECKMLSHFWLVGNTFVPLALCRKEDSLSLSIQHIYDYVSKSTFV